MAIAPAPLSGSTTGDSMITHQEPPTGFIYTLLTLLIFVTSHPSSFVFNLPKLPILDHFRSFAQVVSFCLVFTLVFTWHFAWQRQTTCINTNIETSIWGYSKQNAVTLKRGATKVNADYLLWLPAQNWSISIRGFWLDNEMSEWETNEKRWRTARSVGPPGNNWG